MQVVSALEENKKMVGYKIRSIRLSKGMTMKEFGKLLGVNQSNVSGWEKDLFLPNKERLKLLSKIADITIDELLYSNPLSKFSTEELQEEIDKRKSPHGNAD